MKKSLVTLVFMLLAANPASAQCRLMSAAVNETGSVRSDR